MEYIHVIVTTFPIIPMIDSELSMCFGRQSDAAGVTAHLLHITNLHIVENFNRVVYQRLVSDMLFL